MSFLPLRPHDGAFSLPSNTIFLHNACFIHFLFVLSPLFTSSDSIRRFRQVPSDTLPRDTLLLFLSPLSHYPPFCLFHFSDPFLTFTFPSPRIYPSALLFPPPNFLLSMSLPVNSLPPLYSRTLSLLLSSRCFVLTSFSSLLPFPPFLLLSSASSHSANYLKFFLLFLCTSSPATFFLFILLHRLQSYTRRQQII